GLLAVGAEHLRSDPGTRGALLDMLTSEPRLRATLTGGRRGYSAIESLGDERVAALSPTGADVWDLRRGRRVGGFDVAQAVGLAGWDRRGGKRVGRRPG